MLDTGLLAGGDKLGVSFFHCEVGGEGDVHGLDILKRLRIRVVLGPDKLLDFSSFTDKRSDFGQLRVGASDAYRRVSGSQKTSCYAKANDTVSIQNQDSARARVKALQGISCTQYCFLDFVHVGFWLLLLLVCSFCERNANRNLFGVRSRRSLRVGISPLYSWW